ncbi:hypothetical protein FrEUN1fDRAFT_2881 [Parafrankia sp. EUN1f]|nr:hypothetical protein FrEUN1fDRAFT_2881 [Parafrankia sp. EUN1f]
MGIRRPAGRVRDATPTEAYDTVALILLTGCQKQ